MTSLTLKSFSHYFHNIKDIKHAIAKNHYVLCSGYSGCGKSTLLKLILIEQDWDILEINSSNYESLASVKTRVSNFIGFKSVMFFFKSQKKMVFIDDIDILMHTDRNFNSYFCDLLKQKKFGFPVVCVVNTNYEKKISDITKNFDTVVRFSKLSFNQCFQIVENLLPEEININYDTLCSLIKENAHDLRTVMNHLHEAHQDAPLSTQPKQKRSRFFDHTVFEIASMLCTTLLTNEELYELATYDTNQIVAIVHENVYKNFSSKTFCHLENQLMIDLQNAIIASEIMNKSFFDSFTSNAWEYQCFIKLKTINQNMFQFFSLNKTKSLNHTDFPQVVNKQSLAFNFNKKMIKLERHLNITRSLFTFPMWLVMSIVNEKERDPTFKLDEYVNKNELEILLRYASDYDTTKKPYIAKIKTSLVK